MADATLADSRGALIGKAVLITGAAKRVGAAIARALHGAGADLVLHYRHSAPQAAALAVELGGARANSVATVRGDLLATASLAALVATAERAFGRLDILVNNASTFYPTIIGEIGERQWEDLIGPNLKAPLFLA